MNKGIKPFFRYGDHGLWVLWQIDCGAMLFDSWESGAAYIRRELSRAKSSDDLTASKVVQSDGEDKELIISTLHTCPDCGHYIWAHGKHTCLVIMHHPELDTVCCCCPHSRAELEQADRDTDKYRTSASPGYTIDKLMGIVRPPMNERYKPGE